MYECTYIVALFVLENDLDAGTCQLFMGAAASFCGQLYHHLIAKMITIKKNYAYVAKSSLFSLILSIIQLSPHQMITVPLNSR